MAKKKARVRGSNRSGTYVEVLHDDAFGEERESEREECRRCCHPTVAAALTLRSSVPLSSTAAGTSCQDKMGEVQTPLRPLKSSLSMNEQDLCRGMPRIRRAAVIVSLSLFVQSKELLRSLERWRGTMRQRALARDAAARNRNFSLVMPLMQVNVTVRVLVY